MKNDKLTDSQRTKQLRFKRVATRRTRKLLTAIRLLKKCSRRGSYRYEQEDVERILREIDNEMDGLRRAFIEDPPIEFNLREKPGPC